MLMEGGPFKPGFSSQWLDPEPKPNEDKLVAWPTEFPEVFFFIKTCRVIYCGCGCSSTDQLRLWFSPSEMERLKKHGYKCVKMEVDEVLAQSDIQLIFRRLRPLKEGVEPLCLYP